MSGLRLLMVSSFANIVDLKDVHACMCLPVCAHIRMHVNVCMCVYICIMYGCKHMQARMHVCTVMVMVITAGCTHFFM